MQVKKENEEEVTYIVIKLSNGQVFSTRYGDESLSCIDVAKLQTTNSIRGGTEDNLWIKGVFIEGAKHTILKEPIQFEMNVYKKKKEIVQGNLGSFKEFDVYD